MISNLASLIEGECMMLPTVEVRWFYEGNIPETTLRQFRSGELPQNERAVEERRDLYLYIPGVDSLGIKLRGTNIRHENDTDQLEIKRRQFEGGVVTFMPGVTGRLERWMKWAFHSESSDPRLSSMLTAKDEVWVSVSKVRYQRKYTVTRDKSVIALPLNEWSESGCNVEVTKLIAPDGQGWWTLGLEAFGEASTDIEGNLRLSANYFFAETGLKVFEEKDSYGYPGWLNVLMSLRARKPEKK
jgi:hypothetical protein